jgi:putative flippase GtrA
VRTKKLLNIKDRHKKQLKFIVCGGISALVELTVFIIISTITDVYLAAIESFFCGLITSFFLNRLVVFKSRTSKREAIKEAVRFLILGLVNSQLSSWLTVGLSLIINEMIAKVITMSIIAVWNYVAMERLIFPKKTSDGLS